MISVYYFTYILLILPLFINTVSSLTDHNTKLDLCVHSHTDKMSSTTFQESWVPRKFKFICVQDGDFTEYASFVCHSELDLRKKFAYCVDSINKDWNDAGNLGECAVRFRETILKKGSEIDHLKELFMYCAVSRQEVMCMHFYIERPRQLEWVRVNESEPKALLNTKSDDSESYPNRKTLEKGYAVPDSDILDSEHSRSHIENDDSLSKYHESSEGFETTTESYSISGQEMNETSIEKSSIENNDQHVKNTIYEDVLNLARNQKPQINANHSNFLDYFNRQKTIGKKSNNTLFITEDIQVDQDLNRPVGGTQKGQPPLSLAKVDENHFFFQKTSLQKDEKSNTIPPAVENSQQQSSDEPSSNVEDEDQHNLENSLQLKERLQNIIQGIESGEINNDEYGIHLLNLWQSGSKGESQDDKHFMLSTTSEDLSIQIKKFDIWFCDSCYRVLSPSTSIVMNVVLQFMTNFEIDYKEQLEEYFFQVNFQDEAISPTFQVQELFNESDDSNNIPSLYISQKPRQPKQSGLDVKTIEKGRKKAKRTNRNQELSDSMDESQQKAGTDDESETYKKESDTSLDLSKGFVGLEYDDESNEYKLKSRKDESRQYKEKKYPADGSPNSKDEGSQNSSTPKKSKLKRKAPWSVKESNPRSKQSGGNKNKKEKGSNKRTKSGDIDEDDNFNITTSAGKNTGKSADGKLSDFEKDSDSNEPSNIYLAQKPKGNKLKHGQPTNKEIQDYDTDSENERVNKAIPSTSHKKDEKESNKSNPRKVRILEPVAERKEASENDIAASNHNIISTGDKRSGTKIIFSKEKDILLKGVEKVGNEHSSSFTDAINNENVIEVICISSDDEPGQTNAKDKTNKIRRAVKSSSTRKKNSKSKSATNATTSSKTTVEEKPKGNGGSDHDRGSTSGSNQQLQTLNKKAPKASLPKPESLNVPGQLSSPSSSPVGFPALTTGLRLVSSFSSPSSNSLGKQAGLLPNSVNRKDKISDADPKTVGSSFNPINKMKGAKKNNSNPPVPTGSKKRGPGGTNGGKKELSKIADDSESELGSFSSCEDIKLEHNRWFEYPDESSSNDQQEYNADSIDTITTDTKPHTIAKTDSPFEIIDSNNSFSNTTANFSGTAKHRGSNTFLPNTEETQSPDASQNILPKDEIKIKQEVESQRAQKGKIDSAKPITKEDGAASKPPSQESATKLNKLHTIINESAIMEFKNSLRAPNSWLKAFSLGSLSGNQSGDKKEDDKDNEKNDDDSSDEKSDSQSDDDIDLRNASGVRELFHGGTQL